MSAADGLDARAGPSRRELLIGGACLATGLASALLTRSASFATPLRGGELQVPDQVGSWARSSAEGVLIPQGEGEHSDEKIYDEVATGYYVGDGLPGVMLLIAYGSAQTGTTQLHRPEVCYPAAGFKVDKLPDVSVQLPGLSIPARTMTATATGRTEQILYWSRVGREFPTSTTDQRWSVLRHTFRGVVPDGALVRMSIIDRDRSSALTSLRQFAGGLVSGAAPGFHRLLTGVS